MTTFASIGQVHKAKGRNKEGQGGMEELRIEVTMKEKRKKDVKYAIDGEKSSISKFKINEKTQSSK